MNEERREGNEGKRRVFVLQGVRIPGVSLRFPASGQ